MLGTQHVRGVLSGPVADLVYGRPSNLSAEAVKEIDKIDKIH